MSQKRILSKFTLDSGKKGEELGAKIDETDEMKLRLLADTEIKGSDTALYPAELNSHFIEQIKVLSSENTELRKCVFGKDEEIKEQTKIISNLNQRIRDIISGTGPAISSKSAGIISAKITDLCKSNRHLVAEVESYKTKNAALERKLIQMELYYKESQKLEACACKVDVINIVEASPDELKELKDKLVVVNKKLYETKNKNLELKNEILHANKILQYELGDKFTSIKDLQCEKEGFKGRAQQIVVLNAKISELEEKLNIKSKDVNIVEERRREQQNQHIRELENKRKREIDTALQECATIKTENEELKKKLDGARARMRILECDTTVLRQKMQTFLDKSNHDDLLVAEQRKQIKALEVYYQEILRENTCKMNKLRIENEEAHKEISSFDQKIEAMRRQGLEKTAKIEELRGQLLRYEECSLQSVFFTPMKTATDNEIKKLTELVTTLNGRLAAERQKFEEIDSLNKKLKEKKLRLIRKVHQLDAEIKVLKEMKLSSSKNFSRTSLTRVSSAMARKSTSALSVRSKISVEASKSSEIENIIDEMKAEISEECYDNLEKEDLKNKLELADEKLKMFDDKLKMLEEEKAEDYEHLMEMIQTSKQLFNDALCVLQKQKCNCSA